MSTRLDINRLSSHYWVFVNELNFNHNALGIPIDINIYPTRKTCTIRLSLDSGSHVGVSVVRLLILTKENSGGQVKEKFEPRVFPIAQSCKATSHPNDKVLTIALSAEPLRPSGPSHKGLRFLRPLGTTASALQSNPYSTLHDASYACSPETHAFFISLEYQPCSVVQNPAPGGSKPSGPSSATWHYELRVLRFPASVHANDTDLVLGLHSKSKLPQTFPVFPSQILKWIVSLTTSGLQLNLRSYARRVLSLSLISKQWLPAFDLVWETPSWRTAEIPANDYLALSRSIQQYPYLARKVVVWPGIQMSSLSRAGTNGIVSRYLWGLTRQTEDWDPEKTKKVVQATEDALRCTRGLKVIATRSPMVANRGVRGVLKRLENVEEFRAFGLKRPEKKAGGFGQTITSSDPKLVSMSELLDVIRDWRRLKVLNLSMCLDSLLEASEEEINHSFPELNHSHDAVPFQLETLTVIESHLNGRRLRQLMSHPTSCLLNVMLRRLEGLTHSDIRSFLISCASTLESVDIEQRGSSVSCHDLDTNDRQGLAFDVALENMLVLREATIQGNLFSNLSLIKPLPSLPTARGLGLYPRLAIPDYHISSIMNDTNPCGVGIVDAVGSTEWARITVRVEQDLQQQMSSRVELESARSRAGEAKACKFDFSVVPGRSVGCRIPLFDY